MDATKEVLDRFRRAQALAYACVEAVGADLVAGQSERDVCAVMEHWLTDRGVREWFHQPFAWFGDRTAFVASPVWTPLHFFPTRRRLVEGMPVILDVAPVLDGATADVGYALWFGASDPLHARMLEDLAPHRDLILEGVRAERTLQQIYRDVDDLLADQGYRSVHRQYPFSVIAHRVDDRLDPPHAAPAFITRRRVAGFGMGAQRFLAEELGGAVRGRVASPLWNGTRISDLRATHGLWAVEPHFGFRSMGVKWEELLVVDDADAFWLDDDLPHVRRWRDAGADAEAGAAADAAARIPAGALA